jgi:hypothetical protein
MCSNNTSHHPPPPSWRLSRSAAGLWRFDPSQPTQEARLVSIEEYSPEVKPKFGCNTVFQEWPPPLDHISVSSTNKRRATYHQLYTFAPPQASGGVHSLRCWSRHRLGAAERRPWRFWRGASSPHRMSYNSSQSSFDDIGRRSTHLKVRAVAPSIPQQDRVRQRSINSSAVPGWSSPSKTRASRQLCEGTELNK